MKPQLASKAESLDKYLHDNAYGAQIKFDGKCVFAKMEPHVVCQGKPVGNDKVARIYIARGEVNTDLTDDYPEITADLKGLKCVSATFHGELVHYDSENREVKITAVKLTPETRKNLRAVLVVHDILEFNGEDTTGLPYLTRFGMYRSIIGVSDSGHVTWAQFAIGQTEKDILVDYIQKEGYEGVMFKLIKAPYTPGKTKTVVKWKEMYKDGGHEPVDCVVCGITEGKGKYKNQLGALILGQYAPIIEGAKYAGYRPLVYVGKASGMDDQTRADLTRMAEDRFAPMPFNKKPKEISGNAVRCWCKPEVVVQINYQERTKDGHYRFPEFMMIRTDKPAKECTQ